MLKIWDKKESINGITADEYLSGNPLFKKGEILLIIDDNGVVKQVESVNIIKSNLKLDNNMSAIDVGNKYLEFFSNKKVEETN